MGRDPVTTIGVDPGARWTGIVVRSLADLLWHTVIDRYDCAGWPGYLDAVEAGMQTASREAHAGPAPVTWRVESVVEPVGYEFIRPADLIGLGIAEGWVRRAVTVVDPWAHPVLVRPAGHGHKPLSTYPRALVTAAEARFADRSRSWNRPAGQNAVIRHARSAWDVACPSSLTAQALAVAVAGVGVKPTGQRRRPLRRRAT